MMIVMMALEGQVIAGIGGVAAGSVRVIDKRARAAVGLVRVIETMAKAAVGSARGAGSMAKTDLDPEDGLDQDGSREGRNG